MRLESPTPTVLRSQLDSAVGGTSREIRPSRRQGAETVTHESVTTTKTRFHSVDVNPGERRHCIAWHRVRAPEMGPIVTDDRPAAVRKNYEPTRETEPE